ncbi:UDP-2,4-diacetamido-2,4,6-trideoxy-beta-L-altropyranose hydrolase [Alteromonas antoniana]|uniref:UDP-2,4-diacetamido-2,4, 6-trideoxy-beta-L-altropyranose hydrolase n=1 Tax=Alteromonas antoniana TaxID=2803813 RepID=UPI001C461DCC|nr:UDP-2,4-diacetamido-2,4,6-trideoxy-beta-L-altropyranose hydrolase [Alteromonas antoniana]
MGTPFLVTDILFWAEGSRQKGIGHIIRCLALAQAANQHQMECVFMLDKEAADIARAQHDWDFPVELIDKSALTEASSGKNGNVLVATLKKYRPRILVLDGYQLPVDLIDGAAGKLPFTVVLDDGEQRLVAYANLIVNGTTQALDADYASQNARATLCTGRQYRLLRQMFRDTPACPVEQRQGIVIAFGGSDPAELTLPLLSALDALGSTVPVRVITGPAYPNPERVGALSRALGYAVQHVHQCQDMASAWGSAKLAISAAGGSQFELGACFTPSILVVVAENQREATNNAQQEGWCETYDLNTRPLEIAEQALKLYQDNNALKEMSQAARQYYDAHGASRVTEAIIGAING